MTKIIRIDSCIQCPYSEEFPYQVFCTILDRFVEPKEIPEDCCLENLTIEGCPFYNE